MAYNYPGLQSKIVKKVEKFGTTGTLTPSSTTLVDANDPRKGTTTGTPVAVKVIMASMSDKDLAAFQSANEIGEKKKAIFAVETGVDPKPNDTLVVGGVTWRLVEGKKVAPAGIDVVYIFMVVK